ncbi:MAG: invasion associated locus B family protein [Hyphomicrobiales bacterium]|nr:invasion associated locus B family protein [Hyphomicrobiales bacterium]
MKTPLGAVTLAASLVALATVSHAETKPAAAKPAPAKPAAAAAPPGSPLLIVEAKDWRAFTAATAKGKICFALSKPQKMEPASLNHGDVFFFISTRPAEGVRNEPSLQVGYAMKDGSKATADIDGKKFAMFTKADGAWLEQDGELNAFLDAMKKGSKLAIAATSGRGNATSYVFSLAGISAAVDAAAKECK